MRWEQLFTDLESRFQAELAAEEQVEAASRVRAEVARVVWLDRLRGAVGHPVRLTCTGAGDVAGTVSDVGPDWVLLVDDQRRERLVGTAAVCALAGLGAQTAPAAQEGPVGRAWDLRRAVRALARDRAAVRCVLVDGTELTGTVDRVGADFLELAEHPLDETRRRGAVRQVRVVVLGAIAVLVAAGPGSG